MIAWLRRRQRRDTPAAIEMPLRLQCRRRAFADAAASLPPLPAFSEGHFGFAAARRYETAAGLIDCFRQLRPLTGYYAAYCAMVLRARRYGGFVKAIFVLPDMLLPIWLRGRQATWLRYSFQATP